MTLLQVTVTGPDAAQASVTIDDHDTLADLRAALDDTLPFACHTSYHFEYEGRPCNDFAPIGADRTEFTVVHDKYNFETIRVHIERVERFLRNPPTALSMESWLKALKRSAEDVVKADEVSEPFAADKALTCETVPAPVPGDHERVAIRVSPHDPPTGPARLRGHLVYIDVALPEGATIHCTGTEDGFYVNKTTPDAFNGAPRTRSPVRFATLTALLTKSSAGFRSALAALQARQADLHPMSHAQAPIPFREPIQPPSSARKQTDAERPRLRFEHVPAERSWNDEFLVWSEAPGADASVEVHLGHLRSRYRSGVEFVSAAQQAAVLALTGRLAPLNPTEPRDLHVYLHNNIFMSAAIDSRNLYSPERGQRITYKLASHDLHACHVLDAVAHATTVEGDPTRLHTLLSCLVDYAGHRLICQAIIPGILNGGGSTLLFGALDAEDPGTVGPHTSDYGEHALFAQLVDNLAVRMHWGRFPARDLSGNVHDKVSMPMDCKAIKASDGKLYLMDLMHTSPRDANFPDDDSAVVRHEFVRRWCQERAVQRALEQQTGAAPSPMLPVADIERYADEIRIDINALTRYGIAPESVSGDQPQQQSVVDAMAASLLNDMVPAVALAIRSLSIAHTDCRAMASLFHAYGLNMRYLGHVYRQVASAGADPNDPLTSTLCGTLLTHMVVRASKHMLARQIRHVGPSGDVASCVAAFFNRLLLQPAPKQARVMWAELVDDVRLRFSHQLPAQRIRFDNPLFVVYSVCQAVGVRVAYREFDFGGNGAGMSPDDVVDMYPVGKYHVSPGLNSGALLDLGRGRLTQGDLAGAAEAFTQVIQLLCSITGAIHDDVGAAFANLALVSYRSGDVVNAIDQSYRAIVISEALHGAVDCETARAYSQHALFLMCGGYLQRALHHAIKAKRIYEFLAGADHPDTATALLNVAVVLVESGIVHEALQLQVDALSRLERSIGRDGHTHLATACHAIAFSHALLKQSRDAVSYEKRCRTICTKTCADADVIADCNTWLSLFTRHAVQAAKGLPVGPVIKPTASALSWIAGPHTARIYSAVSTSLYRDLLPAATTTTTTNRTDDAGAGVADEADKQDATADDAAVDVTTKQGDVAGEQQQLDVVGVAV
ncbi:unnamed protein product (mitochondrion) [Plasmodiophora brassicae]|uniref:Clu domain-containing protein n=1 Tax=Plasmodiophora brassicae TaxID=37360 RepID=A0A0G4J7K3_PLABS|nr:hypothetical protein PBRA_009450 [Plasmodiophora brassicae]SPR00249.1 unnamed protein product [Plasmodiophora brassicae]